MNKQIPCKIAGQQFDSYAQLEEKIEMMLILYNDKETIKKQDFSFILDVLKLHPKSQQSTVDSIKSIQVRRNSKKKNFSLYFVNNDGQITHFNYKEYLNEINRLQQTKADKKSKGYSKMNNSLIITIIAVIIVLIYRIIPNFIKNFSSFFQNTQSSFYRFFRIKQSNIEMKNLIPHLQGLGQLKQVALEEQLEKQSSQEKYPIKRK